MMPSEEQISRHPAELAPASGKLRIFDFDDTLVKTDSYVYVKHGDGDEESLTPGEYAMYQAKENDLFDFRDFKGDLRNPREIKWVANILRRVYNVQGPSGIAILTARHEYKPIRRFLRDIGTPGIFVIALGTSDPQAKADYVEQRIIEDKLQLIEFFDDSIANIDAVDQLSIRYPEVKIITRFMQHRSPAYR